MFTANIISGCAILRRLGVLSTLLLLLASVVFAQTEPAHDGVGGLPEHSTADTPGKFVEEHPASEGTGIEHTDEHGHEAHGDEHGEDHAPAAGSVFDPHYGTWLNWLTRAIFGTGPVEVTEHDGEKHYSNINQDYIVVTLLGMALLGLAGVLAARGVKVRPDGKPMSLSGIFEAGLEALREYVIGIMGEDMGARYAPLIASFFFTILLFNLMGLVPGLLAPTANPNIPIALAIVAFFFTHFLAIREAGFKGWFMHLAGEPIWLAPLQFPLHLIGEIIKPISLAIRLLCNMFGKEMVITQLALLAIAASAYTFIPIPFHLPILLLGVFIAFLQALVFSTLLSIYIAILCTHHDDDHGHHEGVHGHTEIHGGTGPDKFIGHPTETTVA